MFRYIKGKTGPQFHTSCLLLSLNFLSSSIKKGEITSLSMDILRTESDNSMKDYNTLPNT